jgi:hypothetical protein
LLLLFYRQSNGTLELVKQKLEDENVCDYFPLDYPKNGKGSPSQMVVIYQYTRRHIAEGFELNLPRSIIPTPPKFVLVGSEFRTATTLKILSSGL